MNLRLINSKPIVLGTLLAFSLTACVSAPSEPEGAAEVRAKLTDLQSDPLLANRAALEIDDAETAVRAAEVPREDAEYAHHLVLIADGTVELARARANARLLVDQREELSEAREVARLEARTREADVARSAADMSQAQELLARQEAEKARLDTADAQALNADLQQQILDLNAEATERGLIVTLGDVLFATGKAELRAGTASHLEKLAAFLARYGDRTVVIEGHADSVGSEASNLALSQQRADAVRSYLLGRGISANRIVATGKGEALPIASNDSIAGREQNRRVEVVISNT